MERPITSLRLKVGNSMHDDMMQEERLVVHFDGTRQQATEVMDIPGSETKITIREVIKPRWGEIPS